MTVDILSSLNKNGSGLNLRDLTASLVSAEIDPQKARQTERVDAATTQISALGEVRAQFGALSTAVDILRQNPILRANSGNDGVAVTITDPSKIASQTMSIGVQKVAQRQVMEFTGFTGLDQAVGAGTLQIAVGTWGEDALGAPEFTLNPDSTVRTLTIPTGATLSMLAETMNSIPGLQARVLDKGDGTFSLGVVSEMGAAAALNITVTETEPGLAAFDTNTTIETVQIQAAQDAEISVDGITVSRRTNVIDDLIPGARLDITAPEGTTTTVNFSRNIETARLNMEALVEQVNNTRNLLNELSARGVAGAESGALAGDRLIEKLKSDLTALIAAPIAGFGSEARRLSDFGVVTNRDGSLRVDQLRFERAFNQDPTGFDMIFTDRFSASDSRVTVGGAVGSSVEGGTFAFRRDVATGVATLDGSPVFRVPQATGEDQYFAFGGRLAGLNVTVPADLTETEVRYGKSFLTTMERLLDGALSSGANSISEREAQLNSRVTEATERLEQLDARAALLEKRYLSRFTAMETAIAGLKSTGTYLDNLVAQWNKSE
ncbi:flagellar filament capping protein FliD [Fuscovulum ytuae]|uniref:Flagellar hook-associated protein 2 n=1 Tax=Fuscovulum ytuae TaxID=3042299 RepID=A0ABY8Q2U0_9RHOB|nr:flagellar filament capping protein FliD [Fuscovulum sp. YMD61]WGV14936.1 flagellar filament capping protein FliD [Fuscovulum sp. YMD61]